MFQQMYIKRWVIDIDHYIDVPTSYIFIHIIYSHFRMEAGLICFGKDQIKLSSHLVFFFSLIFFPHKLKIQCLIVNNNQAKAMC